MSNRFTRFVSAINMGIYLCHMVLFCVIEGIGLRRWVSTVCNDCRAMLVSAAMHAEHCVDNAVNAYISNMDFHGGSKLAKLTYPLKTIYSSEARKKLRLVLDDFKADICHIYNVEYQGLSEI